MFTINTKVLLCASTMLTFLFTPHAHAEELTVMESVIVEDDASEDGFSLTVPDNALAAYTLARTAGGTAMVDATHYEDRFALNFEDTLALTPGVFAQKRFGEEVRLSVRGSGLSRGFHIRGINLLQDGIPFNRADGAGDFQEADPLSLQRLEVFKGANALHYGSSTLGGAVNMVSHTGRSFHGNQARMEFGSDATYRLNLQTGQQIGDTDAYVSLSGLSSGGYRQHDDQESLKLNSNIGVKVNENVETRFYFGGNIIDQDLPGTVTLRQALDNPRSSDPNAIRQDWQRDIRSVRLANKTSIAVSEESTVDVGSYVNLKDLYHPISSFVGVIDQQSVDYGLYSQFSSAYDLGERHNDYLIGVRADLGTTDAKLYQNLGGTTGALRGDAQQDASNVTLYGEHRFAMTPTWSLITGGQALWGDREVEDARQPNRSDAQNYAAFNPKVGVMYEPDEHLQYFANVSRSYELPTFTELTQGGASGFTPVDAQKAWTAELGTRGSYGRIAWDVAVYRAWINGEMLQFTPAAGIPAATFNADDTIHQGLELGATIQLAKHLFAKDDGVTWRNAYTFSDFKFDDDRQYGDNTIPGQPAHFYQSELRYDHHDGWYVATNVEASSRADVDYANRLEAPAYGILNANAGVDVTDDVELFVDARNLLGQEYISTFSTIVRDTGTNSNVFYPGEGTRLFAGARVAF